VTGAHAVPFRSRGSDTTGESGFPRACAHQPGGPGEDLCFDAAALCLRVDQALDIGCACIRTHVNPHGSLLCAACPCGGTVMSCPCISFPLLPSVLYHAPI